MDEIHRTWIPIYRCKWCRGPYVQRIVDSVKAWICPNDACYERQTAWKILDISKRLLYLPLPPFVELHEELATQRRGAICVGGDRSGGKSVGCRHTLYYYMARLENFTAIGLRRNFPELELNHMRFIPREAARLGWDWNPSKKLLTCHDTGATLVWGHCNRPKDYEQFIGADVDAIFFGQLEQFTREQFTEISPSTGRIRRDNWRGVVFAEENPGGPLSAFVNELFVTKKPDPKEFPDYLADDHYFVPIALEDCPYTDPRYVNKLANLGYERREMMRYGRRDVFPGKFFPRFDPAVHVAS